MKITETDKGNIKIVMNKQQAAALRCLLNNLSWEQYKDITDVDCANDVCDIWSELNESSHLL